MPRTITSNPTHLDALIARAAAVITAMLAYKEVRLSYIETQQLPSATFISARETAKQVKLQELNEAATVVKEANAMYKAVWLKIDRSKVL
jgi:phage tail sheath protein FI